MGAKILHCQVSGQVLDLPLQIICDNMLKYKEILEIRCLMTHKKV